MRKLRGIQKYGHNPFTGLALLKALVCGLANIPWWDFEVYDREKDYLTKFIQLRRSGRRITIKPGIFLVPRWIKGVVDGNRI